MPAQSKAQQRFMGMVHAAQKGELENPSKEVEKAADSMNKKDAKDFASTKHKGLPNHVKQEILKRVREYSFIGDKHLKHPVDMKPLRSDDEMDLQEDRIPQNFNVGVTRDYHTKLATTPREKYDDTNFDDENSGQPDLDEAQAVSGGKVHKFITGKNLKFKGKSYSQIHFETLGVDNSNGTIRFKIIAPKEIFGNEMSLDFRTVRRGPFFKTDTTMKEWGSALDNSYILNKDAKLDGTPKEKDAIDRDMKNINESWSVKDGNVLSNGKLIGYYDFDRDSDSFWVDDVKKGKGQLSFDTKKEVEDYFKKNEKDAVKHLGKLRESTTPSDIIKDLDKVRTDLIKKVDVLIAKKKKLYSNVDIESPMSADEKQLDKDIQSIFSQIQSLIQQKRKIQKESINESPESLQKELEYQLKWAYNHFKQNPKDSRYEKVVKDTIDKIKQLKKIGRLENVNEAMNPREDALLKTFKNIVDDHSALKVKDGGRTILVDVQSANAVLKLYDALSDSNKKSLLKMPVGKMIKMAWHVLGKK